MLLLLLCLATTPATGRFDRVNARTPDGRSDRGFQGMQYARFEFAPASGSGMGAACACGAVTGSNGEAFAMTRSSNATCSRKGSATSGIAAGDLVTCGANLPRVEAVTGGLGYLREGAATNVDPRSSEVDDVAYGDFTANGSAAPVLNGADAAAAPDGTVTAEDYTFAATGATQASARSLAVLTAAAYSAQVWIRGVSGSGSMDLCIQTSGTPTATCSTCTFTSSSWTQCKVENATSVAGGQIYLGNMSYLNGGLTRASNRVYVWGLDAEAGSFASSYVPTAGATATRSADSALTGLASTTWGPDFSLASTVAFVDTSASNTTVAQLGSAAPNLAAVKTTNNTTAAYTIDSVSSGPTVPAMGSASHRTALEDALGTRGAWWDTVSVAAPAASIANTFDGAIDTAVTYVAGKLGQAASLNGTTSKIQTAVDGPLGADLRSVSMWLYKSSSADKNAFGYGTALTRQMFDIAYYTGGMIAHFQGPNTAPMAMSTGAWHHFAVTYNGTTATPYLDGVAGTPLAVALNTTNTNKISIGSGVYSGWGKWDGYIDQTLMYDKALTSDEVAGLYNGGAGTTNLTGSLATGLIHHWPLDGNSTDLLGQASLTIGALNARTSAVCADPNPSRCR